MVEYRVQCPACGAARVFPFVRVGAVIACERCGKVYAIEPGQAERVGGASAAPEGLFEAGAGPGPDSAGAGTGGLGARVARASGAEPSAPANPTSGEAQPPTRTAAAPPVNPAGEPAPRPTVLGPLPTPRRLRVAAWAVGLVAAATLAALGVWGTRPADRPALPADEAASPVDPDSDDAAGGLAAEPGATGALATDLPVVFATRLTARAWVIYGSPQPVSPPAEGQLPAGARLESPDPETWLVRVELPAGASGLVERAEVAVELVDEQGLAHAQTRCEAALLMSDAARRLWVEVPAPLAARGVTPRAVVIQQQTMAGGTPVAASVEARPLGRAIGLRVRGELSAGVSAKRVVFVVRAADDAGRAVAEWRCDWDQPVPAGGVVRFQAVVSPGRTQGLSWSVRAAAEEAESGDAGGGV